MNRNTFQRTSKIRQLETAERKVTLDAYEDADKRWRRLELDIATTPAPESQELDAEPYDGLS